MNALDVEDVSHSFGKTKALDCVSLSIPRGGFLALLGINGAGKTTLFSLITRLYDNVSGSIRVAGHDVRREPGPALARLGVVFQTRALDRDLTIRQNLRYHGALQGLSRAQIALRTDETIKMVGLTDRLDQRVAALSGGQSRRAEIARALMHKPEVLLLDEATVGLDVRSRREVIALVRELIAHEGVAALWATHLFDEVRDTDRVTILHHGKVMQTGIASEIAGGGTLEQAFLDITGTSQETLA
jgi:ABC-2 type transport system ATP-binding protein